MKKHYALSSPGGGSSLRVARASRVLVSVSHRNDLFLSNAAAQKKFALAGTPAPARETRALPGFARAAFTIIELLIVMSIIIVLAGLVIATSGYVQEKGKRSRTEAEIAAISAALESYRADNGIYPKDPATTDVLDARATTSGDPNTYTAASFVLYRELSGRDSTGSSIPNAKSYFSFKPQMLSGTRLPGGDVNPITAVRDPFGNNYGYSTANQADPAKGYNPTFDLWSTAGDVNGAQVKWIKNW